MVTRLSIDRSIGSDWSRSHWSNLTGLLPSALAHTGSQPTLPQPIAFRAILRRRTALSLGTKTRCLALATAGRSEAAPLRPQRHDALAGIELAPGSCRLLLAWETGRLAALLELTSGVVRG